MRYITFTSKKKGFTLIEIMTALSIFIVVMTVSMGSIIGVFDANRKSRSLKAVMDNLNFSLESMSRELRFGTVYHCNYASGDITLPQNCPSGATSIAFLSNDDERIIYRLTSGVIEKSVEGGAYVPVTSPEVTISSLNYYVLGAATGDTQQPRVIVTIRGYAGSKSNTRTDFSVQTTVSQRQLDR